MCSVRFEWDKAKRKENLRKHGVDFADLPPLFDGVTVTVLDDRFDYGENRFLTLGVLHGIVIVVAHTETEEVIRFISARKGTNWTTLRTMRDEDIDRSDVPVITPAQFARAVVRKGLKPVKPKAQVTLRIDKDVLDWFRKQGRGYQTRINALLRAYVDAHKP